MNKTTRNWTLAAAVAAAVATTAVYAAPGGLAKIDTDGSGTVSQAEFLARAAERPAPADLFAAMDANADGFVTKRELRKHHKQRRAERRLARADLDGDGLVTEAEFVARANEAPTPEERFAKRDRNDDGVLTADEMDRGHAKARYRDRGARQESGRGKGRGKGHGERFNAVDTDGDGRWSQAEFLSHANTRPSPAERFEKMDADGDGELAADELRRRHR